MSVTGKSIARELRTSLLAMVVVWALTSVAYPLFIWVVAQGAFPWKANGSLIARHGKVVGSALLGQTFTSPAYFHPRPSAAGDGYDAAKSGGSNQGPLSRKWLDDVRRRVADYRHVNGLPDGAAVPADAVTASGSGLDPHISPANAALQSPRVARARGMDAAAVAALVRKHTEGAQWGVFGEERVDVLGLNLDLDDTPSSRTEP